MTGLDPSLYGRTFVPEDSLPPPYGGVLVQAFVPATERPALHTRLTQLPSISLSQAELYDLEMLGSGAYSPLVGFMGQTAYRSVLERGALPDGLPWGLPVTLAVADNTAQRLVPGGEAALIFKCGFAGIMRIDEIYPAVPASEALALSGGCLDMSAPPERPAHPWLVGGPALLLASRAASWLHPRHRWPFELRSHIANRGWRHVGAIHVQHPWQRTHEYLLRCALESSDALMLHVAIEDDHDDTPATRTALVEASRLLLDKYFPDGRLFENPMPQRFFASHPRAILQHAILCQNYGCHSLFLPEEGEAASEAGQSLDHLLAPATRPRLAVRTVSLARAFHCEGCGGIATDKSCPHDDTQRLLIPEAELHRRLLEGEHLPTTVTRPEVARVLARNVSAEAGVPGTGRRFLFPHAAEVSRELRETLAGHRACVLWMTGLSGSGKSTIAHRLERELLLAGHRVFVLDGDTLRHGLNRDLGFSDEARRENLRRAAEVAKVMMEAGLIVVASFISPFRAERDKVREIVGRGLYEVYVEASLEECERRDPKGLYRRARAGQIAQFTGISSPYEPPSNPDIRLDTGSCSVDECVRRLLRALAEAGALRRAREMPVPVPEPWAGSVPSLAVQ